MKAIELRYPQLDLEALAIDFGLRRFRNRLIGASHKITVMTDHKPLCSIFNGKCQGSRRTERIKLRYQDIQFEVAYLEDKHNQFGYLCRKAKNLMLLLRNQQDKVDDTNNLLYLLDTTPIIDHVGSIEIATETEKNGKLQKIIELINNGKQWIPKTADPQEQTFEISITGKGILVKGDRIILPTSLQEKAIILAHRGIHPGQSGLERRLLPFLFR